MDAQGVGSGAAVAQEELRRASSARPCPGQDRLVLDLYDDLHEVRHLVAEADGRIFRLAMLMYGKEPTWQELKRWALQTRAS